MTGGTGLSPATAKQGPNLLHSSTHVLHNSISLLSGYDKSPSPGIPQRPGLTLREMSRNVTVIFSLNTQNISDSVSQTCPSGNRE